MNSVAKSDADLLIFPRHLQGCHFCLVPGGKVWMETHGFDWRTFVREGIPAEALLATGDGFAETVVEFARQENL